MTPEPPLSLGDILGSVLAIQAHQEAERVAADAQIASARALADAVAPMLRRTSGEVFDALTYVHDNMLPLLTTPEGWSALAQLVAADLGAPCLNYKPTVH